MNLRRGHPIPQENGTVQNKFSWIPVTPEKPIQQRSNRIPAEMQGNQQGSMNWHELLGIYGGLLQDRANCNGEVQKFNLAETNDRIGGQHNRDIAVEKNQSLNMNANSSMQTLANYSPVLNHIPFEEMLEVMNVQSAASGNGALSKSTHFTNRLAVLDSHSQVGSSWTESTSATSKLTKQSCRLGSDHRINGYMLSQSPADGFHLPYLPSYNINSPPRSEADAASSVTNAFHFAPVTPDPAKHLGNRFSEILTSSADENSSPQQDNQENLVTSITSEAIEHHCDEMLQNTVDSSSAIVSTSLKEKNSSDDGGYQGIDLNKTPQQKTPKRRKHRPKVVTEGKPKRIQKVVTPKNNISNETPTGKRKYVRKKCLKTSGTEQAGVINETLPNENPTKKRKYVRKKSLKASATEQTDVMNASAVLPLESAEKSCRRVLIFDLENETRDESQNRIGGDQVEIHQASKKVCNSNLDSQDMSLCTEINISGTSAVQISQQNGFIALNVLAGVANDFANVTNQMPVECMSTPAIATKAAAKVKDHTLNVIARNVNRNANLCLRNGGNSSRQVHQQIQGEGIDQIVFQAETTGANFGRTKQLMLQETTQLAGHNIANFDEKRGSKRDYSHTTEWMHPTTVYLKSFPILGQNMLWSGDSNKNSKACSEILKKKRMKNGFDVAISSATSFVTNVTDFSKQVETRSTNGVYATSSISQKDLSKSYFERENNFHQLNNEVNRTSSVCCIHPMGAKHTSQAQCVPSEMEFNKERGTEKNSLWSTHAHQLNFLNEMMSWNQLASIPPEKGPTYVQGIQTYRADMLVKKQIWPRILPNQGLSSTEKMPQQECKDAFEGNQRSSSNARGSRRTQKPAVSIDEITYCLKGLNINGRSSEVARQEQNALVPYNGISSIVPYKGFDPFKKSKPWPKVDLDPETDRIWKLLMGKEGSEETESTDKDKERWWEEERKVFHGRVDSFIARMHLVQGDRRFSQWKGSVVDSVIGVFLTQNVSDHLSSSAFMSLAAKFPLHQTITEQVCQRGTSILIKEQEVRTVDQDGCTKYQEKIARCPIYSPSTTTSGGSSEHGIHYLTSGTRTALGNEHNRKAEEENISSQNYFDTFLLQTTEEIRSSSGSNSEAEDQTTENNPNKKYDSTFPQNHVPVPTHPSQMGEATMLTALYSHISRSSAFDGRYTCGQQQCETSECNRKNPRFDQVHNFNTSSTYTSAINYNNLNMREPIIPACNLLLNINPDSVFDTECLEVLGEENASCLPPTASGIAKVKGADHMTKMMGCMAECRSKTIARENGAPRIQAPIIDPYAFQNKHPAPQQINLQPGCYPRNNQHAISNHEQFHSKTFELKRTSVTESIRPAEALAKMKTAAGQQVSDYPEFNGHMFDIGRISAEDKQKGIKSEVRKANVKEQKNSTTQPLTGTGTNIPNPRKGKAESQKRKTFDWDSLRKQVHSKGKRKERSKDTMDSLDYEAVRRADVSEISNAIKERGMNNMLAERIKDFLNRLVREHGSIDLEWLRDIPPDKSKDYLLSIWGLGLKSVECVRLLTLHHLAFPVDTNVGRIAVRLGWVPLQPLPESLQLHLLELYPVLESIQKYLWPRLCKLDQRTLYELHYQMITFGKVFCTKSKPNCNACPMRGECRHFASAFASARLALPGPEETSMVSSAIPITANNDPTMITKPMMLPPTGNNSVKEACLFNNNHEPIVEEPATPEPEAKELSETDIEDAFYEDPDEIPIIKLDIEEFTLNLHNYMQENNMELQEGDMSKALVALSPEAASIPRPKLKNMSRLRTEHQVYELPDSHSLLKGLDKREPDDPSPYLLAIWTPGETADSIQPPERMCGSQESGKLCNYKMCFSCNNIREANSQIVRGTILIPCRTAMRGSFPLNGTYFQVNEMFADHESSLNPIDVPREWIWNLPRRTVYFGTSVSAIFKGLSTEDIQYCFWRGFVCVRGFDQETRAPRPLMARLHFPASKLAKAPKDG